MWASIFGGCGQRQPHTHNRIGSKAIQGEWNLIPQLRDRPGCLNVEGLSLLEYYGLCEWIFSGRVLLLPAIVTAGAAGASLNVNRVNDLRSSGLLPWVVVAAAALPRCDA
jgi:hypothetical protein